MTGPGIEVGSRWEALVGFTRALRAEGIRVGPSTAGDLLEALETVGAHSGEDVYWAFRSLAVTSQSQVEPFDRIFVRFFGERLPTLAAVAPRQRTWSIKSNDGPGGEGDGDGSEDIATSTGASGVERLRTRDFAELTRAEEAEVRALIAKMVWRPGEVRARRRRPTRVGDRPDMRRTLRRAVGSGGDMLQIATVERKIRRRPLIFIADVSGSMERYSEMLLYFAHAARGRLGRLEAFVFSTHLTRITRELSRRRPAEAIARVAEVVTDWSGGTQIGEALRTFNREWSRRVTRGRPVAIIVSDGWDRGDPDLLSEEMGRLHRTVDRVVWLNPLAGRHGYEPETRGMRAALPYVDHFLPVANLADLESLIGLLESVPAA